MSFLRRMLSNEDKRKERRRKSTSNASTEEEEKLVEIDTNCELKDDGEYEVLGEVPKPRLLTPSRPPPPPPEEAGFICPECMHVAESSESLLLHFQDHNARARAVIDSPDTSTTEPWSICVTILADCLDELELQVDKVQTSEIVEMCSEVLEEVLETVETNANVEVCAAILNAVVNKVADAKPVISSSRQTSSEPCPVTAQLVEDIVNDICVSEEVAKVLDSTVGYLERQCSSLTEDPPLTYDDQNGGDEVEAVVKDLVDAVESSNRDWNTSIEPASRATDQRAISKLHDVADIRLRFAVTLLWKVFRRRTELRMMSSFAKLRAYRQTSPEKALKRDAPRAAVDTEVYLEKSQILDLLVHAGIDPSVLESKAGKKAMPSENMRTQIAKALKAKQEEKSAVETSVSLPKSNIIALKDDEAYGTFFKMLKAKVPRAAIELKMKQKGLDPTVLDKDPESPSPNQPGPEQKGGLVLLKDDKDYGPFLKMLKAQVPRPAIEHKMKQKGLDVSMLDKDPMSPAPTQPCPPKALLQLKDDVDYGPFFKMLKAQVPRPAIELKMKQKGLDPAFLDKDPNSPSPNQPKETAEAPGKVVLLKDDEQYGPFFKMLKAQVPRPAIELKMRQKGLDPAVLEQDPNSPSPTQPKNKEAAQVVRLRDDEEYGPFFKMLKARVPRPAIELKMKQKGLDPAMLDKDPDSASPNQPKKENETERSETVALKDDEAYGPFFKMLKAKVPRMAIELKMKQKGLDPSMLDKDPESAAPNQPKQCTKKLVALKDDDDYGPFFKMLKAKVPRMAIELKMQQKGLDPTMLDKDPESPSPNQTQGEQESVVALKDCEDYGQFFKMLKAKVPRMAIELKMTQKGLDPSMLDKDPDSPSPNQPQGSAKTAVALKDDEDYGPFFKMLKAMVPRPAIELKMKQKGLDPSFLDKDPESPAPNQVGKPKGRVLLQDDENYGPFFKMLKAKVPRPAIEIKMKQKGLDPSMLDKDPATTHAPSSQNTKKKVKLKDDAAYGPFFKMLAANVPRMAIELKMKQKGLDPSMLDKDPNTMITPGEASGGGGIALGKGKAKLKKGAKKKVSIKPAEKKPTVMRRKLHWRKVSKFTLDKKDTVWKKVGKFAFEEKEIEELSRLFVQKIVPKERKPSATGARGKAKAKKQSLLDMQRSQNVTIVLSRVKDWFSCPAIQRALCALTVPKGASVEDVSTVLSFLPSEQEEKTLAAFKGDRKTLGLPEQYFLALMDISRFRIKTQILLFKLKFEEMYDTINDDCAFVLSACTDLIESDKFVRLLEVVLALGNVMNESSVDAFTLDSLKGLRAVKSFVGKTTALNYIALVVSTRQRQVLSFINSEIDKYRAASNIPFSNTIAQLRTLENGCKLIQREYKRLSDLIVGNKSPEANVGNVQAEVQRINEKTIPEEDRVFFHSISLFNETVEARMKELLPKAKQTEEKIASMLEFYCMEPNTSPMEVFSLVQSFMAQFQEAVRENDAARSKAMKRARQRHLQKEKSSRNALDKALEDEKTKQDKQVKQESKEPQKNANKDETMEEKEVENKAAPLVRQEEVRSLEVEQTNKVPPEAATPTT